MSDDLYKARRQLNKRRLFATRKPLYRRWTFWLTLLVACGLGLAWFLQPTLFSSLLS